MSLKGYESLALAKTLYELSNRLKRLDVQAQYLEVKGNGRAAKSVATANRHMSFFFRVIEDNI